MPSHTQREGPRDRDGQRAPARNERNDSPKTHDDETGNWGSSDSDGTVEEEARLKKGSPIDSVDDEDSAFDGYDSEAPHAGRKR